MHIGTHSKQAAIRSARLAADQEQLRAVRLGEIQFSSVTFGHIMKPGRICRGIRGRFEVGRKIS